MQGEIGVRSAPGQGAVFHFSVTLEVDLPDLPPRPTGRRLLVVEAGAPAAEAVRLLGARAGLEVVVVDSVAAARAQLLAVDPQHPFAAVLVDESIARTAEADLAGWQEAEAKGLPFFLWLMSGRPKMAETRLRFAGLVHKPTLNPESLLDAILSGTGKSPGSTAPFPPKA